MLEIVHICLVVILLIIKTMENKYTILEQATGKVLYCKKNDSVVENQIAITQMCTLENPDNLDIYYNFETQQFYTK
jgi:hypothetical protein